MKILHVIPHYFPSLSFGGTPAVCHAVATEQVKLGHQVDILTTDVFSATQRVSELVTIMPEGYRVIRVRNVSNSLAFHSKLHFCPGIMAFLLREGRTYDVFNLHEYRTLLNVAVSLFSLVTSAKVLLQPQGSFGTLHQKVTAKQVFDWCFSRLILSRSSLMIALSKQEAAQFARAGLATKTRLLYFGSTPPPARRLQKMKTKLPKKFIAFVGRLHQVKKLDFLIKAYAQSSLPKKDIKLVIAGPDDGYRSKVVALIKKMALGDSVLLLPALSSTEKYFLYRKSMGVAYVTYQEPFGLVPLEAASVGTRSVIASNSGVAEFAKVIDMSLLLTKQTVGAFARLLEKLALKSPPVSLQAQRQIARLSWSEYTKSLLSLYTE